MKTIITALILSILLAPCLAFGVDQLEFGFTPEFGFTMFFARMGEMISPDISFGADFQYGLLHWIALDFDLLYSEHQQTDSDDIGNVQFNHLQTCIGPRFAYNNPYVVPYATPAFGGNFFRWENRTVAERDEFNGNGMAAFLTLGADFFIADGVTVGLAGKGCIARSDFEFVTNKDGAENIESYALLSALVRFTLIF